MVLETISSATSYKRMETVTKWSESEALTKHIDPNSKFIFCFYMISESTVFSKIKYFEQFFLALHAGCKSCKLYEKKKKERISPFKMVT